MLLGNVGRTVLVCGTFTKGISVPIRLKVMTSTKVGWASCLGKKLIVYGYKEANLKFTHFCLVTMCGILPELAIMEF